MRISDFLGCGVIFGTDDTVFYTRTRETLPVSPPWYGRGLLGLPDSTLTGRPLTIFVGHLPGVLRVRRGSHLVL
jgi:hypothetical protein